MFLRLTPPEFLQNHFCIPIDLEPWIVGEYIVNAGYNTPNRPRATFKTFRNGLIPKTTFGLSLNLTFGIYILAFDIPTPHLYVGIAAFGGKKPEGISSRLKKHRVKATASHVGKSCRACGGVNHTLGWRMFATLRSEYFNSIKKHDCLADARLIVGQIYDPSGTLLNVYQSKTELEQVENAIVSNKDQILDKIRRCLWLDDCQKMQLITKHVTAHNGICETEIILWD